MLLLNLLYLLMQTYLSLHHQLPMLDTVVVQYSLTALAALVLKEHLMSADLQDTLTQARIATIFVM